MTDCAGADSQLPVPGLRHVLTTLGICPTEAAAYELVCEHPSSTVAELEQLWRMPEPLSSALTGLTRRGLARTDLSESRRYAAIRPDQVLSDVLLAHEEHLRRAREHASQLAERYRHAVEVSATAAPIEIVRGDEPVRQRLAQLRDATGDLVRLLNPSAGDDGTGSLAALMTDVPAGVECRAIYAGAAVSAVAGRPALPPLATPAGTLARVLPDVSTSLVIFDDTFAVLPSSRVDESTASLLVIHRCSLLEVFTELFERLWQRAIPLELPVTAPHGLRVEQSAAENQRIMALLLSGLTDQAIARQLGVSYRTVQRRIAGLMHTLGAQTRFQAGVQAALRPQRVDGNA